MPITLYANTSAAPRPALTDVLLVGLHGRVDFTITRIVCAQACLAFGSYCLPTGQTAGHGKRTSRHISASFLRQAKTRFTTRNRFVFGNNSLVYMIRYRGIDTDVWSLQVLETCHWTALFAGFPTFALRSLYRLMAIQHSRLSLRPRPPPTSFIENSTSRHPDLLRNAMRSLVSCDHHQHAAATIKKRHHLGEQRY